MKKTQNTVKIHLHDGLTFQWLRQVKPNDFPSELTPELFLQKNKIPLGVGLHISTPPGYGFWCSIPFHNK
jgi:hypothetical protein